MEQKSPPEGRGGAVSHLCDTIYHLGGRVTAFLLPANLDLLEVVLRHNHCHIFYLLCFLA